MGSTTCDEVPSQREDGLHARKQCRDIEGLEKDLRRLLSVMCWIEWRFRQENRVLEQADSAVYQIKTVILSYLFA